MIASERFPEMAITWNFIFRTAPCARVMPQLIEMVAGHKPSEEKHLRELLKTMASLLTPATCEYPINITCLSEFEEFGDYDVHLCVGEKKVGAHKCVLSKHSEFFRLMFSVSMAEANKDEIEIGEIEFEVLEKVVKTLYQPVEITCVQEIFTLLTISDQFQIPSLRSACLMHLKSDLSATEENSGINDEKLNQLRETFSKFLTEFNFDHPDGRKEVLLWIVRNYLLFDYAHEPIILPYLKYFKNWTP